MNTIHYTVELTSPEAHLFEVTLTIANPAPEGQILSMAAWIPGSYMIRDFARNIVTLNAESGGSEIDVAKLDKQRWQCAPCSGSLVVRYQVYAWELSVRGAHLDSTHGYFNGTSLFLKVEGQEHLPCSIELTRPDGDEYRGWQVATTLQRRGTKLYEFGHYHANDYDELIDHPVEMGSYELVEFEAAGIPHAMAITGKHYADRERLAADLKTICEFQIKLFGELPEIERYLFMTMVVGDGYGGLEHRSSCSLLCSRKDLPNLGDTRINDDYRTFLGLCSHEYFHTWNVKRIKPATFIPYDLSKESHTHLLWAFEGFTSYYDDLTLLRTRLIEPESYLELLGQTITRVLRGSGRFKQTISESSFDSWTKFYKQDENGSNAIVSYYAKGALVALTLDLTIRHETAGKRSLDDVMRALWQRHGKPLLGVTDEGIEQLITEISGVALDNFFEMALRSTDELPLAELLAEVGIDYRLRPALSTQDMGGKAAPDKGANGENRVALGARTTTHPNGAKLLNVYDNGACQAAGLSSGDVIIAIDNIQVTHDNLTSLLKPYTPGSQILLHAFRRDELMTFNVTLKSPVADTCYLLIDEMADDRKTQARNAWMKGE